VGAQGLVNSQKRRFPARAVQELAFETHQAIIKLPGHVISACVQHTRSLPKPAPNFIHADRGVVVTDAHEVVLGLGRVVTLHARSSTLRHNIIHEHIRHLCF
jgi:hypothetical protein